MVVVMDVSHIRKPEDWPVEIPEFTADAINKLIDALANDARWTGDLYDELDGSTRDIVDPDQEMAVRDYYLRERWAREDSDGDGQPAA